MKAEHLNLGESGELLAEQYLRRHGLTIIARRVRYPCGELDLVARDGREWVFVEVKTRSGKRMGGATQAFSKAKAGRMRRAIELYVTAHGLHEQPIRCDVIAVDMVGDTPEITHYPACLSW